LGPHHHHEYWFSVPLPSHFCHHFCYFVGPDCSRALYPSLSHITWGERLDSSSPCSMFCAQFCWKSKLINICVHRGSEFNNVN
jgi:hypothetical protein